MLSFLDFGFDDQILKSLEEMGFKTPTPIQQEAIPEILKGRDMIASAQTGTGKTGAFLLPILQRLVSQTKAGEVKEGKGPSILVLVPTRELAMQVVTEVRKFSKYLPQLKSTAIYGGVPYPQQRRVLSKPLDLIVATPGRLIDHLENGLIDLSSLKCLVLDEADRMLDMGFLPPIEEIVALTPPGRQTLLFSATIDKRVLSISKKFLKNPVEVRAAPTEMEKQAIEQHLYYVDNSEHKTKILEHLLENTRIYQTILFTATKRQADELSSHLKKKGIVSSSLHGDMNQRQRSRTIDRMRTGELHVLVATDVAARGIDIPALTHVINFDLPRNPEDFIHRIGRTGRAGKAGISITFATPQEQFGVQKIGKLMGTAMEVRLIEGLEPKKPLSKANFADQKEPKKERPRQAKRSFSHSAGPKKFEKKFKEPSFDEGASPITQERKGFGKKPNAPFSDRRPSYSKGPKQFGKKFTESSFEGEYSTPKGPKRFDKRVKEDSFAGAPREGRRNPFKKESSYQPSFTEKKRPYEKSSWQGVSATSQENKKPKKGPPRGSFKPKFKGVGDRRS